MKTDDKYFQLGILVAAACCLFSGCAKLVISSSLESLGVLEGTSTTDADTEMAFGLARVAERKKKFAEAEKAYREILVDQPEHHASAHRLGIVLARKGRVEESLELLQRVIDKTDEPDSQLLADIGYAHFLAGNLDAAKEHLSAALAMAPENDRVLNNLAIVYGHLEQPEKALGLFRLAGDEADAQANLAFMHTQLGDLDAAKEAYHRALEFDPDLKPAAHGLLQIHQALVSESKAPNGTDKATLDQKVSAISRGISAKNSKPQVLKPKNVVVPASAKSLELPRVDIELEELPSVPLTWPELMKANAEGGT